MPPARKKPRNARSRVDALTDDLRNLSTTGATTANNRVLRPRMIMKATGEQSSRMRIIATRAAIKAGRQTLVEVDENHLSNLPIRRRGRKKADMLASRQEVVAKPIAAEDVPTGEQFKPSAAGELEILDDPLEPLAKTRETSEVPKIPPSTNIVIEKGPTTVKTSFLLVSDTHDVEPRGPEHKNSLFRYPLPKTDVFIHAGDMTQNSNLSALKKAIAWIERVPAEVKILIAGNHDTCLESIQDESDDSDDSDSDSDSSCFSPNDSDKENKPKIKQSKCQEYLTSKEMKDKGIFYLENEVKTFLLKNGAALTVFGSPYTPRGPRPHNSGAFRYNSDVDFWDKFNSTNSLKAGKVDVTVVHGPAYGVLDSTSRGKSVGCRHLRNFLEGVKPLMSICGHIHEAAGIKVLEWDSKEAKDVKTQKTEKDGAVFSDAGDVTKDVVRGETTVFVNASIVGAGSSSYAGAARSPYVVELDLPLANV
ncbi:hypothetical protein TWF718_010598 [Orbilia javanica]|uniref:Calcineurin-like phosphoesterase domain-containing protein n=1 Tax=Orbilia javanica TaxID=47235 RepID=A0AAN8MUP9_9PEZI